MKAYLPIAILGVLAVVGWQRTPTPVEVTRIVEVPAVKEVVREVPVIEKLVETKTEFIFVDRPVETIIQTEIVRPVATRDELDRVYTDIQAGRYSHWLYANNSWMQNEISGDTELNRYWVDSYDLFRELIERA